MISFIIIARNEAKYLSKCFNSIVATIEQNRLRKYEIIYIDSNSEENNIEIAKSFPQIRIYQLTADYNAAIARNLGAEKSTGEVLFFVDGDMEISGEFLEKIYSDERGLKYDFVSGDFLNINYDYTGNYLNEELYFQNNKVLIQYEVGGLFLIRRKYWFLVNGMRNIFRKSQDIDLALRLAGKNIFLTRLPFIAAYHHTISYRDYKRKWEMIFNKNNLYSRSLLYRYNIFNIYIFKRIIKHDYTMIFLLLALVFAFIFKYLIISLVIYISVVFYRSLKNSSKIIMLLENILYYLLRDALTILGLFLFFPKTPKNIKYNFIK